MSDFMSLSCKSCGAKLDITEDIDRFACSYCGTEQIVKRSGGLVALQVEAEDITRIRGGIDRTAAELAIPRLKQEIHDLKNTKSSYTSTLNQMKAKHKAPYRTYAGASMIIFTVLFSALLIFLGTRGNYDSGIVDTSQLDSACISLGLIGGFIGIAMGIISLMTENIKYKNQVKEYEDLEVPWKGISNQIVDLENEITKKHNLLRKYESLVNSD